MAEGKIPGVRQASIKEVRELVKVAVRDEELSDRDTDARLLPDGRVLLYHGEHERGVVYPSREALEEMNRQCAEVKREAAEQRAAGYPDPCFKLLPPIDDFLRDVEVHASSLAKTIKVAAEALDRSVESLDAVDKALKRIPWAKRPVPEILTPLVAYVGEVMRRASGGRWSKFPATQKREVPVFDSDELSVYMLANGGGGIVMGGRSLQETRSGSSATAMLETAKKAVLALQQQEGGASEAAMFEAARKALEPFSVPRPEPFRFDTIDEPIRGHENEPIITARNGQDMQPFALLFIPMIEPSKRRPLRIAVQGELWTNGYRPAPKTSA
jgi:hypothetical protein